MICFNIFACNFLQTFNIGFFLCIIRKFLVYFFFNQKDYKNNIQDLFVNYMQYFECNTLMKIIIYIYIIHILYIVQKIYISARKQS